MKEVAGTPEEAGMDNPLVQATMRALDGVVVNPYVDLDRWELFVKEKIDGFVKEGQRLHKELEEARNQGRRPQGNASQEAILEPGTGDSAGAAGQGPPPGHYEGRSGPNPLVLIARGRQISSLLEEEHHKLKVIQAVRSLREVAPKAGRVTVDLPGLSILFTTRWGQSEDKT